MHITPNFGVQRSATLYGYPETVPISESAQIEPINPYGHSKPWNNCYAMLLQVHRIAGRFASLRYQSSGSSPQGVWEDPNGVQQSVPFRKPSGDWSPEQLQCLAAIGQHPMAVVYGITSTQISRPIGGTELSDDRTSWSFRSQSRQRTRSFSTRCGEGL